MLKNLSGGHGEMDETVENTVEVSAGPAGIGFPIFPTLTPDEIRLREKQEKIKQRFNEYAKFILPTYQKNIGPAMNSAYEILIDVMPNFDDIMQIEDITGVTKKTLVVDSANILRSSYFINFCVAELRYMSYLNTPLSYNNAFKLYLSNDPKFSGTSSQSLLDCLTQIQPSAAGKFIYISILTLCFLPWFFSIITYKFELLNIIIVHQNDIKLIINHGHNISTVGVACNFIDEYSNIIPCRLKLSLSNETDDILVSYIAYSLRLDGFMPVIFSLDNYDWLSIEYKKNYRDMYVYLEYDPVSKTTSISTDYLYRYIDEHEKEKIKLDISYTLFNEDEFGYHYYKRISPGDII